MPTRPTLPWLLYAYPWMPFPRRVIIYLRERGIPNDQVTIVRVSDPQEGDEVVEKDKYPPRPLGSLPILVVRHQNKSAETEGASADTLIRQTPAIIDYLEHACQSGVLQSTRSIDAGGESVLSKCRIKESLCLAEELTIAWNPVRLFGTEAGGLVASPPACRESLAWLRRTLLALEACYAERGIDALDALQNDRGTSVTLADITLYQFLEFVRDCYGKDVTVAPSTMKTDTYGRSIRSEDATNPYMHIRRFEAAFARRASAIRDPANGEKAGAKAFEKMTAWHEGAWDA